MDRPFRAQLPKRSVWRPRVGGGCGDRTFSAMVSPDRTFSTFSLFLYLNLLNRILVVGALLVEGTVAVLAAALRPQQGAHGPC